MNKRKMGLAVIGLLALLTSSHAVADATITLRGISDGKQTLIQVRNGVARMGDAGDPEYSIYDQARNVFIHVDGRTGTYMEMDKAMIGMQAGQMAGMQDMMAAQMEQMRAQMKNMPPEQRAMMEAQMGHMMGMPPANAAAPGQNVRAESRGSRSVSGVTCQSYTLFDGPQKVADVCMASAEEAGISAQDYATLMAMMDFMRDMSRALPAMGESVDPLMMSDLKGLPMELRGVSREDDFTLQSVFSNSLDAGLFEGYKTFRKQDAMRGGMSGPMMSPRP